MDPNQYEDIMKIINAFDYTKLESDDCKTIIYDIQRKNPACVTLVANILAIYIAQSLPLNMQNFVGNMLSMIGQTIMTYSAQQTVIEQGLGLCYDCKHININNGTADGVEQDKEKEEQQKINEQLTQQIQQLQEEIKQMQKPKKY